MRLTAAFFFFLAIGFPVVQAQSSDTNARKRKSEAPVARPTDRAGGMKACPEYGAGFYRLVGSDTCIRIGGGISTEIGTSSVR